MDIGQNIPEFLAELDGLRLARKMSYQDVADACNVSKATVYRALTGVTEPTIQLVQDIAAAVQYKPPKQELILSDYTQESYISYLQNLVQRQTEDTDRRVKQLHAHYNMLRQQDRRGKNVWMAFAIALSATFVLLFLYDFAHLDRGWIQAQISKYVNTGFFISARRWLRGLLWTV